MIDFRKEKMVSLSQMNCDYEDIKGIINLQLQLLLQETKYFDLDECFNIWSNYSDSLCASWLFFPENMYDILDTIKSADNFVSFEEYSK